jgi:hypothetical protein
VHPAIDPADVAPNHSDVILGVDLQEKPPIDGASLEVSGPRIVVAGRVAAVQAVRDELTLQSHASLNWIGVAQEPA